MAQESYNRHAPFRARFGAREQCRAGARRPEGRLSRADKNRAGSNVARARGDRRQRALARVFRTAAARRLDGAANSLRRKHPELSAGTAAFFWQKFTAAAVLGVFTAGSLFMAAETSLALFAFLAVPFSFVILLRGAALAGLAVPRNAPHGRKASPPSDRGLPVYSLLIPLYQEAAVVPDLVVALSALDYPLDRLDILLIVESGDFETRSAIASVWLEPHFRVVVVPGGLPRTKPRALNYALCSARGEYIAVYDAEDLPEPDQLRKAVAALRAGGARIGCVQARLDVHNSRDTWLTRQFTIEYAVLFGAILPMLERLGLPIPLGGTSNHFLKSVLMDVHGWDPFNVTEDADLGIRLARLGWTVRTLDSTTWEEAPASFPVWLGQRSRWLKGWMQTYVVHMRRPLALARQLGIWRFFGFHVLLGSIMLSALVHPWFYVMVAIDGLDGQIFETSPFGFGGALQIAALFNLAAGYMTAIALGVASIQSKARRGLGWYALSMPVYWLAISFAAYRALYQFATAPFHWEKTAHAARTPAPARLDGTALNADFSSHDLERSPGRNP